MIEHRHPAPVASGFVIRGQALFKTNFGFLSTAAELAASFGLIASGLVYLSFYVGAMATSSLWRDEIDSVMFYSGRGPLTTVTLYDEPNNHIFFNLLNSLTPGAGLYDPLRARLWSFIFFGAALVAVLVFFFRRKQYFVGAFLFDMLVVNSGLLELNLQARGYGFLGFAALTTSLLVVQYIRDPRRVWLALICVLTVLGVWTVPNYALFACPLVLLLFLFSRRPNATGQTGGGADSHTPNPLMRYVLSRRRDVFVAGLLTVAGIVITYAPVFSQLLVQLDTYANVFGRRYTGIKAVVQTVTQFLLHPSVFGITFPDWLVYVLLGGVVLAALVMRSRAVADALRILVLAAAAFIGASLYMQTPPVRTTAFVVMPIAVCVAVLLGAVLDLRRLRYLRPLVAVVFALLLARHNVAEAYNFRFVPIEDWQGTAQQIARTFPDTLPIYAPIRPSNLDIYLPSAYKVGAGKFDQARFAAGGSIVVDNAYSYDKPFPVEKYAPYTAGFVVRQQYATGQIRVAVAPPGDPQIVRVTGGGQDIGQSVLDRDPATAWVSAPQSALATPVTLQLDVKPGQRYRSVFLTRGQKGILPANGRVRLTVAGGAQTDLDSAAIDRDGDVMILHLDDRPVERIELTVSKSALNQPFALSEVWAYPTTP